MDSNTSSSVINANYICARQTVTGVVTDESGLPIPGVNVLVKGTSNGTNRL